nr:MAG TPA: hypothetical protein [Caudoviricetes sp.]
MTTDLKLFKVVTKDLGLELMKNIMYYLCNQYVIY